MSGATGTAGGSGSHVIREFLMKLGYAEDEASRRKFTDGIKAMTLTVASLGAAVASAAAGVVAGVRSMAQSVEGLYYVSQRTGASIRNIRALEGAFQNLGGTAEQARAALEKIGDFVRSSPGAISYIEYLTNGKRYTDAATALDDLSDSFKRMLDNGMDIAVVMQMAAKLGLSNADFYVLIQDDYKQTAAVYKDMADKIIGDQTRLAANARDFMRSYRFLYGAITDFALKFGDTMNQILGPEIEKLRAYLLENSEQINEVLKEAAEGIAQFVIQVVRFGINVGEGISNAIKWYKALSPENKGLVKELGAIVAVMLLMNTAFGRSPIGMILALATAVSVLYNDYKEWQRTNQVGLVDWSKWQDAWKVIEPILNFFGDKLKWLGEHTGILQTILDAFSLFLLGTFLARMTKWALEMTLLMAKNPWMLAIIAGLTAIVALYNRIENAKKAGHGPGTEYKDQGLGFDPETGYPIEIPGTGTEAPAKEQGGGAGTGTGAAAPTGDQGAAYKPGGILGALGISEDQYSAFKGAIAGKEKARYNQMGGSSNKYAGRYQMGPDEIRETARALGVPEPTTAQFLSDPDLQERFFEAYTNSHHQYLMTHSKEYRDASPTGKLKILAYAHNQGAGGAANWLRTGQVGRDAFGTAGTAYADAAGAALTRTAAAQPVKTDDVKYDDDYWKKAREQYSDVLPMLTGTTPPMSSTPAQQMAMAGQTSNDNSVTGGDFSQTNHININLNGAGSNDPAAVARKTAEELSSRTENMFRNNINHAR